jgi:hypothetical protein
MAKGESRWKAYPERPNEQSGRDGESEVDASMPATEMNKAVETVAIRRGREELALASEHFVAAWKPGQKEGHRDKEKGSTDCRQAVLDRMRELRAVRGSSSQGCPR